MATSACVFPLHVIEDILYELPLKSLGRLKSTCKEWNDLISDNRFISNLIDQSPQYFIRNNNDEAVHILEPEAEFLTVSAMPNEFRTLHPIYKMVHCDGLVLCLCLALKYGPKRFRSLDDWKLALWNPLLWKMKWIQPMTRYSTYQENAGYRYSDGQERRKISRYCGTDSFGIGYHKNSRGCYKILRLSSPICDITDKSDTEYEICEPSKSESWRSIDANFDGLIESECEGVSVKGNMYYIAVKKVTIRIIICFDFSTETFNEPCLCPTYANERLGSFNGDRLSLLHQDTTRRIHVWMTNKLSDSSVSFSKYFVVNFPDLPVLRSYIYDTALPGYLIGKDRNIMVWCEQTLKEDNRWHTDIMHYEIDEGGVINDRRTARFASLHYRNPHTCSYVYVPSLVPVPGIHQDCS